MKSVNEVLAGKRIAFESTYIYPNAVNTTTINFLEFDLLVSHHDIHEYTTDCIESIIEKYTRRYHRLLDTIKSEKEITFIRYCKDNQDLSEIDIHNFIEAVSSINNSLKINFILCSDNKLEISNRLLNHIQFIHLIPTPEVLSISDPYQKTVQLYKSIFQAPLAKNQSP